MTSPLLHAVTASAAMIANDTIVRYLIIAVLPGVLYVHPPWGGDLPGFAKDTNGRPKRFSELSFLQ